MSISQILEQAITWLLWASLGLGLITIISFLVGWKEKFRFVGATIFSLLLSASCWAFSQSYSPPASIEGALYLPVVYDNGQDLVVAQATDDFPKEAIKPTLEQIAGNLKGGGRNGVIVHVKIRKLEFISDGISKPIILGEAIRDIEQNKTVTFVREESQIEQDIQESSDEKTDKNIDEII